MSLEENEYIPPYYLIKANNTEFKTYTQSGVDISTQILDRFKVVYTVEHIKE